MAIYSPAPTSSSQLLTFTKASSNTHAENATRTALLYFVICFTRLPLDVSMPVFAVSR